MKKVFLKLLIFISIFYIPISSVSAETWTYTTKKMPMNDIMSNLPEAKIMESGLSVNGGYKLTIHSYGGKRYKTIHIVHNTSGDRYQGYCLHVGKQIYVDATLSLHKGFDDLPASNGNSLTATQQEVLKNILASGYQNGNRDVTNFLSGGDNAVGTCTNKSACRKLFATQLLVWEVVAGARTNYNYIPNLHNPDTSPHNLLVEKNSELKTAYKNILSEAEDLATDVKTPKSFGKTFTLKWSDASSKYVSDKINIGDYAITTDNTSTLLISNKDKNNAVVVSSTKKITNEKTINAQFKKGNTTKGSTDFRWFRFVKTSAGATIKKGEAQDVVMGDYSITKNKSFKVKTEEGIFKISKVDAITNETLKGSKFKLYKCSGTACATKEYLREIDLTNQAQTVDVSINKSGEYLFEEVQTPKGYESIGQFRVEFSIDGDKAIVKNIYSDLGNVQKIDENKIYYSLVVQNKPKEITINKINGINNEPVNGATFQIRSSNGQPLRFDFVGGTYRYSQNGSITDIVDPNKNNYSVTLLPEGEYILTEINVPYPFSIQGSQSDRETKIKIDSNSDLWVYNYTTNEYNKSLDATVTVKNFTTEVEIIKSGEKGELLDKIIFELYDSNKQNQIRLIKNDATGNYEYAQDQTITPIQVITNQGRAVIKYLPAGTYWLKETSTGDYNYVIDKDVEWTQVEVKVTRTGSEKVTKTIRNKKATFNFYKIDEDGNYLSSGKFKLQKYNTKKAIYEDTALTYNEKDNTYTTDETGKSDLYTFTPKNGIVTFVDMDAKAKYRIIETEPPEGFVLPKASETHAEVTINENGYAIGDTVIINKKITVGEGAQASAELIINISTGQTRIRYTIIISILVLIITALFIINRKMKK